MLSITVESTSVPTTTKDKELMSTLMKLKTIYTLHALFSLIFSQASLTMLEAPL